MTLKLFPESKGEHGQPWSSLFSGMFTTLRRTTSTEDASNDPTADVNGGIDQRNPLLDASSPSDGPPSKRRKIAIGGPSSTRPQPTARRVTSGNSSSRHKTAGSPRAFSSNNTIERYFTAGPAPDATTPLPEPEQLHQTLQPELPPPRHSLYDTIQKTVHDAEAKSEDKRTLRSQDDGSRLKSDLATYFPQYEEIINDLPKVKEVLNTDTILIIKDQSKNNAQEQQDSPSGHNVPATSQNPLGPKKPPTYTPDTTKFPVVDLSVVEKQIPHHPKDPLSDEHYFKAHRKAERREKQLRNIERERAMHEKIHLERLLDGLKGHDWLRVMGVTGITDGESQKFESKREFFMREVQALVDKFKEWREEEKRLKFEKTQPPKADEEEGLAETETERTSHQPSPALLDPAASKIPKADTSSSVKIKIRSRISAQIPPIVFREPTPEGPFVSFFSKPHLRAAALGSNRHGRTLLAFGQPVPEPEGREFSLPPEYTTPDSLKESARRRRRMKRESIMNSTA